MGKFNIGDNVDVSGCSPEVIKAITQTLSKVKRGFTESCRYK